jgi:hypothetical protein
MGAEKLDNAVYLIRGLYDLSDMARSKHDGATFAWAKNLASKLEKRFDSTWWYQAASQYSDSLQDPGNQQLFQQYWIGQTPMEAELHVGDQTVPGVAPFAATPRCRSRGPLLQRDSAVQPRAVPHRMHRPAQRRG